MEHLTMLNSMGDKILKSAVICSRCSEDTHAPETENGLYLAEYIYYLEEQIAAYVDSGLTPERIVELGAADKNRQLVVLPLSIGTKVYDKYFYNCERKIMEIEISKDLVLFKLGSVGTDYYAEFYFSELNDRYFLTREEAKTTIEREEA